MGGQGEQIVWAGHTTIYGGPVKGSRRSIAFLQMLDEECKKHGFKFHVIQSAYNTGVPASAGTHDFDACYDVYIEGLDWPHMQRFIRVRGGAAWWRKPPTFSSNHIHFVVLPSPRGSGGQPSDFVAQVGIYVPGQVTDYYNHALGLAGEHDAGDDPTFHPDPQPIFNYEKFLKEHTDMDMSDKIPGTDVTVGQYFRRSLHSMDAIAAVRAKVNEVDGEIDKLPDSATPQQVHDFRIAVRDHMADLKAKLASLEGANADPTPSKADKPPVEG